jgi:hypothetical protein
LKLLQNQRVLPHFCEGAKSMVVVPERWEWTVQTPGAFAILTWAYVLRHTRVHVLTAQLLKSAPRIGAFSILTSKCASRHSCVRILISHPTSCCTCPYVGSLTSNLPSIPVYILFKHVELYVGICKWNAMLWYVLLFHVMLCCVMFVVLCLLCFAISWFVYMFCLCMYMVSVPPMHDPQIWI